MCRSAALAAASATLAVAGCGGDDEEPPAADRQQGIDTAGEVVNVEIVDRAFQPPTAEVAVGDTVVWKNTGDEEHTVTSDRFDSQRVPAEFGTFQHELAEPRTVEYRCEIHPEEMQATVVVTGE